jgi:7-carboxy-7-deazaguanine synthase
MGLDQIVQEVERLGMPLVLLTGGEPMLQKDVVPLAERLVSGGYEVMIETSGAHPVSHFPSQVVRIVDVKTPGSGENHRVRWDVIESLGQNDAIKFVLADEQDYHWAAEAILSRGLHKKAEILLSPVHGQLDPVMLVGWMLRDRLPARLNLQVHKYLWGQDKRGV